ncbi:hypothetical protein [Burkholderia seminalis]|uniref:hypothetical protein n=1 Tax=Burkholderia seminalis TaxID=488731 RepID=UPI000664FF64|nr:hypothetical protein [Burkholderia seminalis]MBJ9591959.1 hypothetical protein [Burkholderia seminalis]MCA8304088.1 hypothetical protein [Burkholderia seminalis]MCA8427058.1 hypothetical protein [Burkholderia seminalis]MCA8429919.1 hypothetical protein [Burkholderia seminalis]RQS98578.1 hypothetical protein DF048_05290 [Burkholderia seminalis]
MKRIWLAAFMLASTLGAARAQTQTFHFGEGQTRMPAAAPQAGAPTARHAPSPHHRRAVHKRRHSRHAKPTRNGIYTHA